MKTAKILTLPRINLNPRQLCDLELLMTGGFAPLGGFLNEDEYRTVVDTMRLPDGHLWPVPVVLDLETDRYRAGSQLVLCDEYGKPLAILTVDSVYKPDKKREAKKVFGTTDTDHFGVRYLMTQTGAYYAGGKIEVLNPVDRFDFTEYRKTPAQLRKWFADHNWKNIIGFQTRNPIHRVHFEMMRRASEDFKANVLIHPSVGLTKDGDIDYVTRVRSYIKLRSVYMKDFAALALLPLAMRMAGPREALWHALIRKNYGVTHFIVGRDHAGPGADRDGVSFYPPYEAQELVKQFEKELGMIIIPYKEMMYLPKKRRYVPADEVPKGAPVSKISGTKVRSMIRSGSPVPAWISFPEVVEELRRGMLREKRDGLTVFFTGLPSAGKSTIARILYHRLLEIQDRKVTYLDGDIVRQNLSRGLGFSREDRITNIRRIGFVANEITKHGGIVICSAVSPYEEARRENRRLISRYGTYVEVFVSTPLSVCRKRDVKGLYGRGKIGTVTKVTGVDDPYEVPKHPELTLRTVGKRATENAEELITYLRRNSLI